jgi:hypothetical protein
MEGVKHRDYQETTAKAAARGRILPSDCVTQYSRKIARVNHGWVNFLSSQSE